MRLAASAIKREIQDGNLTFNPQVNQELIVDSSVDLTLSGDFISLRPASRLAQAGVTSFIEIARYNFQRFVEQLGEEIRLAPTDHLDIPVQQLVLGYTQEIVGLPQHLGGRVEGKSGYARIGLFVHISAPTVHPGFRNRIMLEFYNVGPLPVRVHPGDVICQLVLERVEGEGMYQGQFQS